MINKEKNRTLYKRMGNNIGVNMIARKLIDP